MKLDASAQNILLLAIVGVLGVALVFHEVPLDNREAVSMVIGGCLALLRGAPSSAPSAPSSPQGGSVGQ